MLRWRLFSAAILISMLLTSIWLDFHQVGGGNPGAWLFPICLVFTLLGTKELLALLQTQQLTPVRWPVYVGTLFVVAAAAVPIYLPNYPADCPLGKLGLPLTAAAIAVGLVFIGEMLRYKEPGGVTVRIALSCFVILYLGVLMSFIVELRLFRDNGWGLAALVSMILVTKICDAGAYFTGRAIGRHKMTPVLSPKKTWEGAAGGITASIIAAGCFFTWVLPKLVAGEPPAIAAWRWILYGAVLAVVGMIGDLAESLLKRDLGQKDSSHTLPGLGGVLDVLDSLLFTAPVAMLMWASGLLR